MIHKPISHITIALFTPLLISPHVFTYLHTCLRGQVSFRAFRVACHPSFGSRVMEEIPVDLEPYDVQAARVEEQWEVR